MFKLTVFHYVFDYCLNLVFKYIFKNFITTANIDTLNLSELTASQVCDTAIKVLVDESNKPYYTEDLYSDLLAVGHTDEEIKTVMIEMIRKQPNKK